MKFVIMKSGFGDYWIGRFDETKVDLSGDIKAFNDYEDALEEALGLADSIENQDILECECEENIEELNANMIKWKA